MKANVEIVGNITYYNLIAMPQVTPGEKKGTWRLLSPYTVQACADGDVYTFWIKEGFVFDGAFIPRLLWRLCGHPMEAPRIAAALIHDWLYRAQLTDRGTADELFNVICKAVGMTCFRTGPEWAALRFFGWAAWNKNHEWDSISHAREYGYLKVWREKQ